MTELLTQAEHDLITKLGQCMGDFTRIVGDGRSRDADLAEFCTTIHYAQAAVMSQAAARAYPDQYRLLGGVCAPKPAPIVFDDGPDFDPMHPPIDLLTRPSTETPRTRP